MMELNTKELPSSPGVYLFSDKNKKVIYIGKAIDLRSRIRSYWNQSTWSDRPKLQVMMPKVVHIETIITKSEKEALILESNLVFKHQPKYNVLLKANNKNFPWLIITYDEPFPRLIPVRNLDSYKKKARNSNSKNKFFGPYTNISAMYQNLELVNELFPLRKKRVPPFKNRTCLNYDLGKCLGPCQKLITESDYQTMLDQVEVLLEGKHQDLLILLEEQMKRYSKEQEYEKAAKIRDRIKALKTFNEGQNVISENSTLNLDAFVLIMDDAKNFAGIQIFKTREGRLIHRDSVELDFSVEDTKLEILETAIEQYYAQIPDTELPKEILLEYEYKKVFEKESQLLEEWLSERKQQKVTISFPRSGAKYAQVQLAKRNALLLIEKIKLDYYEEQSKDINIALENLQRELGLNNLPQRIECYDISHTQGTNTVASMVCFIDGLSAKDQYRRFKISKDQNNDYASMQEVISRRFKNFANSNEDQSHLNNYEDLPNLIIIDGGRLQLNAAIEVMQNYNLEHIPIIGLAKKQEEIYLPNQNRTLILDRKSAELFLVQRIRNEAHRFAITYHRKLRAKKTTNEKLDRK